MKHFLILLLTNLLLILVSCNNQFKDFEKKKKKIEKGMSFRDISIILGKPQDIYMTKDIIIANYDYGNSDGYKFSIGLSKDSIVLWKEYDN